MSVRLVQMKGVDLAQFQFDYDLTWVVFFLNADGAIYGRYGARSVAGPMAHQSMESLKNAMRRALQLHRNYPKNRANLEGKRGPEPRWKTALEIPALWRRFGAQLMQPTGQVNCIQCHNIYEGWHETAYDEGSFKKESIWRYPLPDNIGMQIDVDWGNVVEKVIQGSFAETVGVKAGDVVQTMNGQPIISIADMQWVLHNLPSTSELRIEVQRDGQAVVKTLSLSGDWKKSDISWRKSTLSVRPAPGFTAFDVSSAYKEQLGIAPDALALEVWFPSQATSEAGLVERDVLVEVDGHTQAVTAKQFDVWIRLNYQPGDQLPIRALKGDQIVSLTIPLR